MLKKQALSCEQIATDSYDSFLRTSNKLPHCAGAGQYLEQLR